MFDPLLCLNGRNVSDYINVKNAVWGVNKALKKIDVRLVDHGSRVAYIALEICKEGNINIDRDVLFLLCVFHDIGAYKTDEIDHMVEFETGDVKNHSVYGYLFIKLFSPLEEYAEAILYHHSPWDSIKDTPCGMYAGLIHLADRYDIAASTGNKFSKAVFENNEHLFSGEFIGYLKSAVEKRGVYENLKNGHYAETNSKWVDNYPVSGEQALQYIRMLVYSLDFRSEASVTHTSGTVAFSLYFAEHFGIDDLYPIYLGALLHDCGKIAIPYRIVEKPGRLTDEEMKVMRTHVNETEQLCRGVVSDEVLQMAVRHHETLDGSGYPRGLTAADLTLSERIITVADILSALCGKRSYKEPFPKEKVISIIEEMAEKRIDPDIARFAVDNYDDMITYVAGIDEPVVEKYKEMMSEYNRLIG